MPPSRMVEYGIEDYVMQISLDQHIEASPAVRGGKPCIAGTRISVNDVVLMHLRLGQSLEQIAGHYDLSLSSLHAAMSYYYDHRAEIDRNMQKNDAFLLAAKESQSSFDRTAGLWRNRDDLPDFAAIRREWDRERPT